MIDCHLKNLFTRSLNSGGSCRGAKLHYIVSGVPCDEKDPGARALAEVRHAAPAELDGADLARVTLSKSHGGGIFEVQAEYEQSVSDRSARKRIGDRLWVFDTTGGREKVLYGKLIRSNAAPGEGAPPDPGSLINWNGKNGERFHADGAVKIVPSMRESCIAVFRNSDMTHAFRRRIMTLTGCVNADSFHNWDPGEVLFLGASSGLPFRNDQGSMIVEVTFRFAIRPNVESLKVAGVDLGKAGGWEIPWSIMQPTVTGQPPVAAGVYLSSIYEEGDFSGLKI